jgi:aerobic-type carbon monoxide dehydrogenase small subunit (CoxS/CutS family)
MITINVNGTKRQVDADPEIPLLWVLRDNLGVVGTEGQPGDYEREIHLRHCRMRYVHGSH